ncbi:MAG: efflux transporter periplasmic adaptor subunit [Halobacteriovoraceae bacterium]|nr:efflux transporter periplasmic adaptor subunit [Halobacteriovoraceae bacterium]|tara:strand:+ start:16084 stop:17415 length:1332 start_codon:yes stop_codon:yes gene_type:complete
MKILNVLLLFLFIGCSPEPATDKGEKHEHSKTETYYTCSMHPQIRQEEPGNCPICGMGLTKIVIEKDEEKSELDSTPASSIYYCEADPSVTSEAPGECPLDGSPMLLKNPSLDTVARVKLREAQVDHFRADVFEVTKMTMQKNIRLLGRVLKSEQKESNIPARVPGRVEEVFVKSTGAFIKKGDLVLKLYSPELLTGGEEYLIARKNYFSNKRNKTFKELYEQSIQRLKLWGVTEEQLENWAKQNAVPRNISIYSPVTGIVEKKNAVSGKYFKVGESFFDLVDLSSLWVEMDVYEHDSGLVATGQMVEFEFSAYPGEKWKGVIDFINPVLDEKTRTLKVRATLDNTNGKLKPGMVGTASVQLKLDEMPLVIPRTAIVDTGKRKVVWLQKAPKKYEAQEILTGFESEGYVEVKEGLKLGDQVVIDGNFLLDAQAQLFGGYEEKN